ncbi:MAG: hypothetical protein WC227_03375 [Patescibacteria group bacterium]|jgi:hypothetical protein
MKGIGIHFGQLVIMAVICAITGSVCYEYGQRVGAEKAQARAAIEQQKSQQIIAAQTPDWARISFAIRVYDEYRERTRQVALLDKQYTEHNPARKYNGYTDQYELAVYLSHVAERQAYEAYLRLKPFDREAYCWTNKFSSWMFEGDKSRMVEFIEFTFPEEGSRSAFYEECKALPQTGDIWDTFDITTAPGAADRAYDSYKTSLQNRGLWVSEPE